jgi:hypothetical protein
MTCTKPHPLEQAERQECRALIQPLAAGKSRGDIPETTLIVLVGSGDFSPKLICERNVRRTPNTVSLGARTAHTRFQALGDQRSLEFSHGADDLEH